MNYQYNLRVTKFIYEDILTLYARFGYNEFVAKDTKDLILRHSLKKLLNYAVISNERKTKGIINYKLSKYVVNHCEEYVKRYEV